MNRNMMRIIATDTLPTREQGETLQKVLDYHGTEWNSETITYACLECWSIGHSANKEARDTNVRHYDFACCDATTTVVFTSLNK